MKKTRTLASLIIVIVAIVFGSDQILDINILELLDVPSDTTAPIIDTSSVPASLLQDRTFDTSLITCTDNVDETCDVTIDGSIDTSVLGEQTLTITAIDSANNETVETITITIVEEIDSSMYIPEGYYDGIEGLTGDDLKSALNDIITNHTEYPYTDDETDVWDILREADEDPNNPDNVLLFYTGLSIHKDCQQGMATDSLCTYTVNGEEDSLDWNREHIWSKSRGDFEIKEGTTTVLDMGAHTDGHHLVAAERTMNSTKNNRMFEDCHDGDDINVEDVGYGNFTCNDWEFEPRDEVKGDVARMIFYMAVRYEGETGDMVDLEVINDPDATQGSKLPVYGDIDDLLRWHYEDPVSEAEVLRNQIIYQYQGNRNPFIDMPELVELIWGSPADYN